MIKTKENIYEDKVFAVTHVCRPKRVIGCRITVTCDIPGCEQLLQINTTDPYIMNEDLNEMILDHGFEIADPPHVDPQTRRRIIHICNKCVEEAEKAYDKAHAEQARLARMIEYGQYQVEQGKLGIGIKMEEVTEALEKGVEKWELVYNGLGIDYGANNCALCALCGEKETDRLDCDKCILYVYSGELQCNPIYSKWLDHQNDVHRESCIVDSFEFFGVQTFKTRCDECRDIAKEMLNYLEEVLKWWKNQYSQCEALAKFAQDGNTKTLYDVLFKGSE